MLEFKMGLSEFQMKVLQVSFTGQETIEVDLTDFYKDQSYIDNLYLQIDEYVKLLPIEAQKELYDLFYKMYVNDFKSKYTDPAIVNAIERDIARASQLLNYPMFRTWIAQKEAQMIMPESIKDIYIYDPDMNTTQEKTYVRHEYRDLIGLIVFMRALSPLYIDFYNYIKQITPHYYYKLFMLFVYSDIYTCEEIEKLKRYIEVNQQTLVGSTKNEHLIISAGLSDDDILDSLVSEIIFSKLITIDFFNKKCNIISFIFQTIKYKGNFASSDGTIIRSKTTSTDATKDDISYFEDYRKTSDVPLGTKVEIQHALSNLPALIQALGYSNFDYAMYERELTHKHVLAEKGPEHIQIYMLGWFLDKVINPRALFYIEHIRVIELMLLAKVALIQNGHEFIGVLMGSYRGEGNYIHQVIRYSLNKRLIEQLAQRYQFVIEEDKQSTIEKTVTEVGREIVNNLWVPTGDPDSYRAFVATEGYLNIPTNVNDLVCSFVGFVNAN